MISIMEDGAELFRKFMGDKDFMRWLAGLVLEMAYGGAG